VHAPEITIRGFLCTPVRHQDGLREARRAVVEGGVGDVHLREEADQALELEDRLERPLADLGWYGV